MLRQLDRGDSATCSTIPTFQTLPSDDDADATDGRMLSDPDGIRRYHGETSGATFLDYLKSFMLKLGPVAFSINSGDGLSFLESVGQYQTFDSRPLPNPDGKITVDDLRTERTLMWTLSLQWIHYGSLRQRKWLPCLLNYVTTYKTATGSSRLAASTGMQPLYDLRGKINTDFVRSRQVG